MYGRSHQLATRLISWARVELKRCGVLHISEWNWFGTQNGMNVVNRYSYYTWTADSWTMYLYPRGADHGSVLLQVRVAMNTSISHCYGYGHGLLQHCRTAELTELRKICCRVGGVGVYNYCWSPNAKHLSLLPNRMSPTPLHIICVGGGGDKYHNKIFSSNQNNCECAQVPALTGLRKDARFSDAKTTLQLLMSVRHHHFLQKF